MVSDFSLRRNDRKAQFMAMLSITADSLILSGINQELAQQIRREHPNIPGNELIEYLLESASAITTDNFGSGISGDIHITTSNLKMSPGVIATSTEGSGNAGNVVIDAVTIVLDKNGTIETSTVSAGHAGNIIIQAKDNISLIRDSSISSSSDASGDAGTIHITTDTVSIMDRSGVFTAAHFGKGGNITLIFMLFLSGEL